jgi:hypothetical protein
MKNLSYSEMEADLKKRFPGIELLCNSNYSQDYPKERGFWVRNCGELTYSTKDKNTLYLGLDYYNRDYELNIYKKFEAFCQARGWWTTSEDYTLQIFK